jgi:hypothetical protein
MNIILIYILSKTELNREYITCEEQNKLLPNFICAYVSPTCKKKEQG